MELFCPWSPRELNIDRDPHEPPDANLADRRGALRAETASLSDARRVSYRYARRSSLVNTRTRGGSGGRAVGGSLRRLRKPGRGRCVVREGAFGGRTLARARAPARVRTCVRDAPALPRHSTPFHLRHPPLAAARAPKQTVSRARTPKRMGEHAPSRRARDHPHQPATRPHGPSARLTNGRRLAARAPRDTHVEPVTRDLR